MQIFSLYTKRPEPSQGYRTYLMVRFIPLLATAVCLLGANAAFAAQPVAKKPISRRPVYQHMKPFEDLSNVEDPNEVYDRALSAFQGSRYDEAEKLFKKVLTLTPKNADAKYNLGAIAEWRGNLASALRYYKDALALKPGDGDIQKAVSDVQNRMKIAQLEQENKTQAGLVESGQRAKRAFASGDYYEAARQLHQLARIYPHEAKVHFALGQSLRALKSFEWSAYHLKMAIYLDPTDDSYRKAIVDLDHEIQLAQEKAINDSAQLALLHLRPYSGGEAICDMGL
ncbi:MAG: tetratricopeptide repeat protein [Candidatus Obscuribacterales bacterium]|nr:tetratricopeptide repeat protein [Candidatus Obscuribacterales bacterium]